MFLGGVVKLKLMNVHQIPVKTKELVKMEEKATLVTVLMVSQELTVRLWIWWEVSIKFTKWCYLDQSMFQ